MEVETPPIEICMSISNMLFIVKDNHSITTPCPLERSETWVYSPLLHSLLSFTSDLLATHSLTPLIAKPTSRSLHRTVSLLAPTQLVNRTSLPAQNTFHRPMILYNSAHPICLPHAFIRISRQRPDRMLFSTPTT